MKNLADKYALASILLKIAAEAEGMREAIQKGIPIFPAQAPLIEIQNQVVDGLRKLDIAVEVKN